MTTHSEALGTMRAAAEEKKAYKKKSLYYTDEGRPARKLLATTVGRNRSVVSQTVPNPRIRKLWRTARSLSLGTAANEGSAENGRIKKTRYERTTQGMG